MSKYSLDISTKPNGYGFGKNWSLVVKKDGEVVESRFLGQDVKVASRILGLEDAMEHYASIYRDRVEYKDVVTFEDVSEMIARDIWIAITGGGYDHHIDEFVGGEPMTDENLEKIAETESWGMAVE